MRGSIMLSPVHSGLLLLALVACADESRAQEKTVTPVTPTQTAPTQTAKSEAAQGKMVTVGGRIVGLEGALFARR